MEATLIDRDDDVGVAEVRIPMTKAEFLRWNPDDEFVYEYNDGFAEQTESMKNNERHIVRNIQRKFRATQAFIQDGYLFEESDCWLTVKQMRRPDMAFFTDAQIKQSALGLNPIPAFVVEIISENDHARKMEKKIVEYFTAGVQVVWHVYPADLQLVRVFLSARQQATYFDTDVISAAPALPDLQMTVAELFTV
jgi:Uma2 family endonuclease